MSLLFFAVVAWFVLRQFRRAPGAQVHSCRSGRWSHQRDYAQLRGPSPRLRDHHAMRARAHPADRPAPSRYDVLKRRYVNGELTDEQYEQAVDTLLREPGGMKEI